MQQKWYKRPLVWIIGFVIFGVYAMHQQAANSRYNDSLCASLQSTLNSDYQQETSAYASGDYAGEATAHAQFEADNANFKANCD